MHRLIDAAHERAPALLSTPCATLDTIIGVLLRDELLNLEQIVALVQPT